MLLMDCYLYSVKLKVLFATYTITIIKRAMNGLVAQIQYMFSK